MSAFWRIAAFTAAPPGWLVHVSTPDHVFNVPLAGWVTLEFVDEDEPGAPNAYPRRIAPGWVSEGFITYASGADEEEVMVVAPGEMVRNHDVLNWHNDHVERLALRRADRFAIPD